MIRLADGDRAAFDPMFDALWPIVRRFSLRLLQGSADAEDAAQAAMMKVFSNIDRFDPSRDPLAWILGITGYECRTLRQKRRRSREISLLDADFADPVDGPEHLAITRDLLAAAIETVGNLSPSELNALRAHIEGDRPKDNPTFRKRLSRALARLKSAFRSA